jgi:hypothetical protein
MPSYHSLTHSLRFSELGLLCSGLQTDSNQRFNLAVPASLLPHSESVFARRSCGPQTGYFRSNSDHCSRTGVSQSSRMTLPRLRTLKSSRTPSQAHSSPVNRSTWYRRFPLRVRRSLFATRARYDHSRSSTDNFAISKIKRKSSFPRRLQAKAYITSSRRLRSLSLYHSPLLSPTLLCNNSPQQYSLTALNPPSLNSFLRPTLSQPHGLHHHQQ